ncbi:MAG TPA: hypothetical protein PKA64_14520, partial [Myxococcota bacterium]|nr:hypothetical protein [Myxococcota bacterium]
MSKVSIVHRRFIQFAVVLASLRPDVALALCGDSDGDGLPDTVDPWPASTDGDHDGLLDGLEVYVLLTAADRADSDGDGLSDGVEVGVRRTDPRRRDTDGDGLDDGVEIIRAGVDAALRRDCDGDLVSDELELRLGLDVWRRDTDRGGLEDGIELLPRVNLDPTNGLDEALWLLLNPLTDLDRDGLPDATVELLLTHTSILDPDTDGDGVSDGDEVHTHGCDPLRADTDGDGLDDGWEIAHLGLQVLVGDTDHDGLDDGLEVRIYLTDPGEPDSDGDGAGDGEEIAHGTDPRAADSDGDGLFDGLELHACHTDPTALDSDGDGLRDADRSDRLAAGALRIVDVDDQQLARRRLRPRL